MKNQGFNSILSAVAMVGRFAFLMRTMAGMMIVVIVACLAQIPGLAMFIQDLFIKSGEASPSMMQVLPRVFMALLFEGVIFFLVINSKHAQAVPLIIGALYMNLVAYTTKLMPIDQLLQSGTVQDWMVFGAVCFLASTPAYTITVFSKMIAEQIENNMSDMITASDNFLQSQATEMGNIANAYFGKTDTTVSTTPKFQVKRPNAA